MAGQGESREEFYARRGWPTPDQIAAYKVEISAAETKWEADWRAARAKCRTAAELDACRTAYLRAWKGIDDAILQRHGFYGR